jgi:F0F1-type ATP synthase membrane subunit b/b'
LRRIPTLIFAALLVAAALPAAEKAEEGADRLLPWKAANFALLAGALGYIAYKKGGAFFAARSEAIRRGLDEAARASREAEARYAEMERRLANLGEEVEKLKAQASEEAGAEGERVRAETGRAIQKAGDQAAQDIAAAAKAARQELRAYGAEMAVSLAEKRIRERLTPDSDGALVATMLKDLERRPGSTAARAS